MSFLTMITAKRLADANARADQGAVDAIRGTAAQAPPARDFAAAITGGGSDLRVIAELKRASPAKGLIALDADAASVVADYQRGGAAAISILTEPDHFQGSLADLRVARTTSTLPVLRKDFICHPLHVWEARSAGADAVLLIVAALAQTDLVALIDLSSSLGMAADIEVHDAEEVRRALDAGARIIAINARNLSTLEVDLGTIERVRPLVPSGIPVVAESGITSRADVERVAAAGVDAIHVGETLMRSPDRARAIRELLGEVR